MHEQRWLERLRREFPGEKMFYFLVYAAKSAGYSIREIARYFGVSKGRVQHAVRLMQRRWVLK